MGSQPSHCPSGFLKAPETHVDSGAAWPGNWSLARKYSPVSSQQEEALLKYNYLTRRNIDRDLLGFPGLLLSKGGAKILNVGA